MKRGILFFCAVSLLSYTAAAAELEQGAAAPDFSLKGTDGQTHSLDQYKGKEAVVVAWFPKAKTKGCTAECKSMRDSSKELKSLNVAYFTASCDTPELNKEFSDDLKLDFPILSDPTKQTATDYGVLGPKGNAQRWTFYIDKQGKIAYVDKAVKTATAGQDIAAKVKELGLDK